ncbi:hypothetical protein Gotur_033855 [Gossypium turneri]
MGCSLNQTEGGYQVHSLEEFERYNSSTPRHEEEDRGLCFEYIRLSCLPQGFKTC